MNIETLTLESFMKDHPELLQALQQAEKEYRSAWDDKKSSTNDAICESRPMHKK